MPSRDLSRSRAVLIGTWDYEHLPEVPAARNSLERMRALLTGELCGWPDDRVTVIGNRPTPGDLHDQLIELYSDTDPDGVALFYFVGHGQPDDADRLCLGLVGSRTAFNRRASTSLRFDDVRGALTGCAAQTKIVMLDCCFAGLAARPHQSLSGAAVLDLVRGAGAYTMAASGAYLPAWFETDADEPQTYFTKYFVDVVQSGIAGQPAGLPLDRIFAEAAANLQRDRKPEPTHTARHEAGRTVFARNAAPVEHQFDGAAEIARLHALLADTQAEVAALRAKDLETDQRLRAEPQRTELLSEAHAWASRAVAAEARQAEVAEALRDAGDVAEPAGSEPVTDVLARLTERLDATQLHDTLIDAAQRPVAEVAEIIEWLLRQKRSADVATILRWAGRRPVADIAGLTRALFDRHEHGEPADHVKQDVIRQLMRLAARDRPMPEVAELMTLLRGMGQHFGYAALVTVVAVSDPLWVLAVLDGLRAEGHEPDAQALLRMVGLREDPALVTLARALRRRDRVDDLFTVLGATRTRRGRLRRRLRREARQTSMSEQAWRPLVGRVPLRDGRLVIGLLHVAVYVFGFALPFVGGSTTILVDLIRFAVAVAAGMVLGRGLRRTIDHRTKLGWLPSSAMARAMFVIAPLLGCFTGLFLRLAGVT
jgi:hypothetical protein